MNEYKRIILLILIMTAVAAGIGIAAIMILYFTALDEQRSRLVETAQSQARLMEAVARFDRVYSVDYPEGSEAATIAQVKDAHERYLGFGATGEFTLARRVGDNIVFILRHRHSDLDKPQPVPFDTHIAEPMRRALSGKSGTVIGRDYRDVTVLAAHEPVAVLDLGIVAKIDLSEIRAPFLRAAGIVALIAMVLIASGTMLFFRVGNPIIQRIRTSEERFRSMAASAPDAIISLDKDGCVTFWNSTAARIFGYDSEEILGRNLSAYVIPEPHREHHMAGFDKFGRSGQGAMVGKTVELEALKKDGEKIPVELSLSATQIEGEWYATAIVRDITERKRMDEALKESEATLAEAQRLAHLGSWVWYIDSGHQEWSDEQYRLFGYEPGEIQPTYDAFLAAVHPDDHDTVIEAIRNALVGTELYGLEFRIRRPDGSIRFIHTQGKIYRTTKDQPSRIVGTALDITQRKEAEDALQQAHHALERRVEERTAELVATNRGLQQEITARKHAEAALRTSEQRYAKAAEIAHFGYWDRDFNQDVIVWSSEVYRIFGITPGHFDGTYESFLRLVHPDDRKQLEYVENTTISTGEQLNIEYRIVRPDATERVIHAVAEARFDQMGKLLGLHGVVHDITQRKRAEEGLRHSLRYQEIIASILRVSLHQVSLDEMLEQALALVLTGHGLQLENKGCIFLVEDDGEEMVMKVRQGLPDSIMESCGRISFGRCLCGRAAQTASLLHVEKVDHQHECTYSGMTAHGHYCAPIQSDGNVLGVLNLYVPEGHQRLEVEENFVTAIADTLAVIIRRRRAERALAEAQARYEDLYDNAPDMFASVDADTANIIQCNQTMADALGYTKNEIVGHTIFDMCHRDCLPEFQKAFDLFLATGEVRNAELQLQRKDGSRIDASLNVTAVRGEDGRILHSRTAWRDITERKLAEKQAREHQAQLAHIARLGTMGELATGIAHEVNQPLTAMVTSTQACVRMLDSGAVDFDKLRDVMREVAMQGLRAGEIIRRLREFTRMKEPKGTPIDLNRLVREAARFVEAEARDKGITIVLDLADALPEVVVDAIQIEQVILNLLRNGMDATTRANRADDATLAIKTKAGKAGTVQLSVSDTGPGLSEEIMGRIFDPFFTTKPQGMGMGLSISRSIIEAHKGRLWADDLCRDGATFHFTLPSTNGESRVER